MVGVVEEEAGSMSFTHKRFQNHKIILRRWD